jgi:hypothetical protein
MPIYSKSIIDKGFPVILQYFPSSALAGYNKKISLKEHLFHTSYFFIMLFFKKE